MVKTVLTNVSYGKCVRPMPNIDYHYQLTELVPNVESQSKTQSERRVQQNVLVGDLLNNSNGTRSSRGNAMAREDHDVRVVERS